MREYKKDYFAFFFFLTILEGAIGLPKKALDQRFLKQQQHEIGRMTTQHT